MNPEETPLYFNTLPQMRHAGSRVPRDQKLTSRDRAMIQALTSRGFKRSEVARMYDVDPSCVRQIELGTWITGHGLYTVTTTPFSI